MFCLLCSPLTHGPAGPLVSHSNGGGAADFSAQAPGPGLGVVWPGLGPPPVPASPTGRLPEYGIPAPDPELSELVLGLRREVAELQRKLEVLEGGTGGGGPLFGSVAPMARAIRPGVRCCSPVVSEISIPWALMIPCYHLTGSFCSPLSSKVQGNSAVGILLVSHFGFKLYKSSVLRSCIPNKFPSKCAYFPKVIFFFQRSQSPQTSKTFLRKGIQ